MLSRIRQIGLLGMAGSVVLGSAPAAAAEFTCDLSNVAGIWGFNMQSRDNTSPDFPQMAEPFAAVGFMDLRPNGSATILLEIHAQGLDNPEVSPFQLAADGFWTVDPSCFGQIDFVLTDDPPPEGGPSEGTEGDVDMSFVAVESASKLRLVWGFVTTAVDANRLEAHR